MQWVTKCWACLVSAGSAVGEAEFWRLGGYYVILPGGKKALQLFCIKSCHWHFGPSNFVIIRIDRL